MTEHRNNDSTVNNNSSYVSNNSTYIEEIFPKALCEMESSIDKLKKCYFSFYKKKMKSEQNANSLINCENYQMKMDINTLKKLYFDNYHKDSNDIIELYSFYKEHLTEFKAKTFRNTSHQKNVFPNENLKFSSSAMKKTPEFNDICKKSLETPKESNLSQHLRKIYKSTVNEKSQKNKLSLSILNKDIFNQKLNFINVLPMKNSGGKSINTELFFKSKARNSKSVEKMSSISIEKWKNNRNNLKLEEFVSPNNKKSNIFSSLPKSTQQKIFSHHAQMTSLSMEKIREISKIFKNYRSYKSELPSKIEKREKSRIYDDKFMSFMESFFEKSEIEAKLLKNEEIDEKSFLEGLQKAVDYNTFKDISNDPSFNIQ